MFRFGKSIYLFLFLLLLLVYFSVAFLQGRKAPLPQVAMGDNTIRGHATVSMVSDLMRSQLEGHGGWLPNDLPLTPGAFLDNLPNYQLGILQVLRHSSRVLRDNLTRQRTSDAVQQDTDLAFSAYANDPLRWAFPSAEGAFNRGVDALRRYRDELGGNGNFYPRADNMIQLLDPFTSELGAVTTVLLDSQVPGKVPWLKIDDNFYYAQGVGNAMLGMMMAVREDFAEVLRDKNAMEITDLIIDSLGKSQFDPWVVTNGRKDGILANHSANLKVYLDDARQKMKSLVSILDQG